MNRSATVPIPILLILFAVVCSALAEQVARAAALVVHTREQRLPRWQAAGMLVGSVACLTPAAPAVAVAAGAAWLSRIVPLPRWLRSHDLLPALMGVPDALDLRRRA